MRKNALHYLGMLAFTLIVYGCEAQGPNVTVEDANNAIAAMKCVKSEYGDEATTILVNGCSTAVNFVLLGNNERGGVAAGASRRVNSVGATGYFACYEPFEPTKALGEKFHCSYRP